MPMPMPMSMPVPVRVITVCLDHTVPVESLADAATSAVSRAITAAVRPCPVGHFLTSTRWRTSKLLLKFANTTAGGPIRLLDLQAMQALGRHTYWYRHYHVWRHIVAGTRPASPWWTFADRHRANPDRYSMATAQQQYLAQPRIQAMRTYNMLANKVMQLPTAHLEALQTGADCYAMLGGLAAVPADAMITLTGRHLSPTSDRMADWQTYLGQAHAALTQLSTHDQLVAVAIS